MPLVFPVVLLLILGAVTLASRSTNSYLAATKQSDSQAAREAAESGMNLVLTALDPSRKTSSKAYISYLLGTTWQPGTGWRLAGLAPVAVQTVLRQCNIAEQGPQGQSPPTTADLAAILNSVLSTDSTDSTRVLRYEVKNYTSPIDPTLDIKSFPTACSDFTSMTGGTARISVEGSVWRNNRKVASYTLARNIDVQGLPSPAANASFSDPGLPTSLRIESSATATATITQQAYADFDTDANPTSSVQAFSQCNGSCAFITPTSSTTFPTGNIDLPPFPVDTNSPPPAFAISGNVTLPNSNCVDSPSDRAGEKDCWIQNVSGGIDVTVNTTPKPVNLFFLGSSVGSSSNPITIIHDGYNFTDRSTRARWTRLRIFGRKPQTSTPCTSTQDFYIKPGSDPNNPSLSGAFVWLPQGRLVYGNGGSVPSSILSSWWVCGLNLNSTGVMSFISPLNGNPEAMKALLPGGYVQGGNFVSDRRFGAYPVMFRNWNVY